MGQILLQHTMKLINVMGASVDGRIASSPQESDEDRARYGFTNPADRRHLDGLLREADAVIVGGHSVNVSGGVMPMARQAGGHPTWILMTNHGFPMDAPVWRHAEVPKWLASETGLPEGMRGDASNVIVRPNGLAEGITEACRRAGFERVLLFGGGRVNRLFYEAGLVDELVLTLCPVIVGRSTGVPIVAPELDTPVRLTLQGTRSEADMVFIHYLVER